MGKYPGEPRRLREYLGRKEIELNVRHTRGAIHLDHVIFSENYNLRAGRHAFDRDVLLLDIVRNRHHAAFQCAGFQRRLFSIVRNFYIRYFDLAFVIIHCAAGFIDTCNEIIFVDVHGFFLDVETGNGVAHRALEFCVRMQMLVEETGDLLVIHVGFLAGSYGGCLLDEAADILIRQF